MRHIRGKKPRAKTQRIAESPKTRRSKTIGKQRQSADTKPTKRAVGKYLTYESLKRMVQLSDVILVELDTKGNIVFVNQKGCEILGCDAKSIIGRNWFAEFIPENNRGKILEVFNLIMGGQLEPVRRFENPVRSRTGEERLIAWHNSYIRGRDGRISGTISSGLDITELMAAIDQTRESQRMLSTLMGNLPGMAYRCLNNPERTMSFVSQGCLELTGYEAIDIIGNKTITYGDIIIPEDRRMVWDGVQAALEKRQAYKLIYRIAARNGEIKWVWEQGCGVFSDSGELLFLEGFITDITPLKKIQDQFEAEKEKMNVTLHSIGDAVIATDIEGRIELLNPVAEKLTGYSQEESLGKPLNEIFKIINEETQLPQENPVTRVLQSGLIVGLANHTVLISRDGTKRQIADSGAPIHNKQGRIIGVVLVFRDISEERRIQEIITRAQRLETAGIVAGQVAHDFNNLLAPLIAYPEFIRREIGPDNPAIKYVDDIETASQKIAEINQQLLTLGRRGHYNLEPLNLNQIVRQAVMQIYPVPDSLKIELDLAGDIANIKGGGSQVFRAISNLITNAREAMNDSGILTIKTENYYVDQLESRFGMVPRGEYVRLTVSDSGPGIPQHIMQRIFDPFFTTKVADRRKGSGLGLSVVDAVVNDHGGFIDLVSEDGKGTAFYIYFPITRESIEIDDSDVIPGGSEKILVVDDDEVQRAVLQKMLTHIGYQVKVVESGERAVECLRTENFDLLLLDMVMPNGIDGAETYRRILEFSPGQKAIIVSGFAGSERVAEAINMGIGAFVRKPLNMKDIARTIRKVIDRKAV